MTSKGTSPLLELSRIWLLWILASLLASRPAKLPWLVPGLGQHPPSTYLEHCRRPRSYNSSRRLRFMVMVHASGSVLSWLLNMLERWDLVYISFINVFSSSVHYAHWNCHWISFCSGRGSSWCWSLLYPWLDDSSECGLPSSFVWAFCVQILSWQLILSCQCCLGCTGLFQNLSGGWLVLAGWKKLIKNAAKANGREAPVHIFKTTTIV